MESKPQNVREWHSVSPELFQTEIIPLHQPAILRNLATHWPAIDIAAQSDTALAEYIAKMSHSGHHVETFVAKKQINNRYFYNDNLTGFNFERIPETFAQAVARVLEYRHSDSLTAYVGSVNIAAFIPEFEKLNPMSLLGTRRDYSAQIWIGNSATVSTHFDVQDNIACLVSGERTFTLFPPEQIENLYVSPLDNSIAGPPASLVNIDEPDLEKHPLYREALKHAQVAELKPGDAIFIPNLWWHNVRSRGDFCTLVNYWWDNSPYKQESGMYTLLHGLYTIAHLPSKEREAWKALFEHYIFRTKGDPLGHLPEHARGVLGKMTPSLYQKIKSYVIHSMTKSMR